MLSWVVDRYVEMGAAPSREVAQTAMEARHPWAAGAPEQVGGIVCAARRRVS